MIVVRTFPKGRTVMWATLLLTAVASQAAATNPVMPPPAGYPVPLTQPLAETPAASVLPVSSNTASDTAAPAAGVARSQGSGDESVGFAAMAGQVIGDQYLLPDQPLFLPRATVVPQGFFVVETNYLARDYDGDSFLLSELTLQNFNGLVRYGLNDRLELRVAIGTEGYETGANEGFFGPVDLEGQETTLRGGAKVRLNTPEESGPLFSILGEAGFTQFEDDIVFNDFFARDTQVSREGSYFNGRLLGLGQWAFGETFVAGVGGGLQFEGEREIESGDGLIIVEDDTYGLFNAFAEKRFDVASTFVEVSAIGGLYYHLQAGVLVPLGERFVLSGNVGYGEYSESVEDDFEDEGDIELDGVVWGLGIATAF